VGKKVNVVFDATLKKNPEKGGAWLARVTTYDEGIDEGNVIVSTAWSNASAGKRWIKSQVLAMTPRKSVKLETTRVDKTTDKPTAFVGVLEFKS
jgi:hypothetical protein